MTVHPTKQQILETAIEIIDEHGEAALRLQDIQDALGVSAPSIYHFFGSREGLVSAAHEERFVRSLLEFEGPTERLLLDCTTPEDIRAALSTILRSIFDAERAPARMRRISAIAGTVGRPELAERFDQLSRDHHRNLAASLEIARDRGLIRPDLDLVAFASWMSGQILGRVYIELGATHPPDPDWDAIAEASIAATLFDR